MFDLQEYLKRTATQGFERFEFGGEMLASLQGDTNYIRGSDSLATVYKAINTGETTIDPETQTEAHKLLVGETMTDTAATAETPAAENSGWNDYLPKVPDFLPSFGLEDALKTWAYSAVGLLLLGVGLFALVAATDTGKAVIKDAAKAAA